MTEEQQEPPVLLNDAVLRQVVWDLLPHEFITQDVYEALGLSPIAPDVEEMEHVASHERMADLGPIALVVSMLATMAGEVIARAILARSGQSLDPDQVEELIAAVTANVVAGSTSVVAELLAMGAIEVGGVAWYE